MGDTKAFELKVGVFVIIGITLLFFVVFSMGDIYVAKKGYHVKVQFNFASGIGPSAPIRYAGVGAGHVEGIGLVYDEKEQRSKAMIYAWIQESVKIEEDAVFTINTLGLLGEKYLEIMPGTPGKPLMKGGDVALGRDPVPMEKVTENLAKLSDSLQVIVGKLERGEGTMGKLLQDDALYNNLTEFSAKLTKGEGTLGRLMSDTKVYDNLEGFTAMLNSKDGTVGRLFTDDTIYKKLDAFVEDIKRHPWKLLSKGKGD